MSTIYRYGPRNAIRQTTIGYPSSLGTVTYGYDSVNRLTSMTDWNSNATAYAYDDANR